jgi:cellulose synthase/poly-beta-1,6-N-acetylglucosamine synthase-like glycosyltransferase
MSIQVIPANPNDNPRRYSRFWFRFFEALPGTVVWICLIAPFILSYYVPLAVTIFIILFDVYWLLRSLGYGQILLKGYRKFKKSLSTDWLAKLKTLESLTPEETKKLDLFDWRDIYHTILITTYKEDATILRKSIDSLQATDYPKDRIIVLLATEERAGESAREMARELEDHYRGVFAKFIVTTHPDNIPGEVKAKGANASWAARQLTQIMKKEHIPLDHVIVSTADADSRFHEQFLSNLTYHYLTTPDRVRACYQPVAMYFNNIWEAPMISRVLAFGTTFWQLIESIRDYRLITFATHATSLQTLHETDYWCTSIVNEDSRQFFRAYFHYNGRFRVIPLFMPIYMDAVHVPSKLGTLKNLYLQQQRWAYGAEHFPYIVLECFRRKEIPLGSRALQVFRAFSGSYSWATSAFFLTVVGWLPLIISPQFQEHVAASNFPLVTQVLLSITWIGLLVSSLITLKLLNTVNHGKRPVDFLTMFLQWLLVPIATIFFGALPGIDSQTRLMFGKYIGFRVTEKAKVML